MIRGPGADSQANLPREARLLKRRDFLAIQRTGERFFSQHFVIVIRRGATDLTRLGVTASKRVGNAVRRNRWKRIMREAFRHLRADIHSPIDIVVVARSGNDPPAFPEALRQLRGVLRRHGRGGARGRRRSRR